MPASIAASKSVSAQIVLTTTAAPTFEYTLERNNTCVNPVHVRFLLQQKGDDLTGRGDKRYYRWWSYAAYELAPGSITLRASLSDLGQWKSVYGEQAEVSDAATGGFKRSIANLGAVGFSFGGGCFYGHGVRVSGGSARFAASSYIVK
jgi:hypothetical protein